MHSVTTEAELLGALADESIRSVVINGDLTLTQPLTVTKPVYVYYDSSLTIPEGEALTVDGSIFVANGRVVCDGIDVVNGGHARDDRRVDGPQQRRRRAEHKRRLLGILAHVRHVGLRADAQRKLHGRLRQR